MKPLFAIDLTENKKNQEQNGEEFLVQAPSSLLAGKLESANDSVQETIQRSRLPLALQILRSLCGGFAALLIAILVCAVVRDGWAAAYALSAWAFWCVGGCALVWIVLLAAGKKREREALLDGDAEDRLSVLSSSVESIYAELGVPETAKEVDVLLFRYRVKKGEPRPLPRNALNPVQYAIRAPKTYLEDDCLVLTWLEGKYAFPRSAMKAIRTVRRRITFAGWCKDLPPFDKSFKPFLAGLDQNGFVRCKWYHILEIEARGETWGLYFPNYELQTVEELTGLKADE